MKFKVGDKVKVRDDLITNAKYANEGYDAECFFTITMANYRGKTATIMEQCSTHYGGAYKLDIDDREWYWTDGMLESVSRSKIVITTDGSETLARLYEGNKVIKSATAKCSPDDKFDAIVGARIAFDRLIAEATKREYKVGQIYRVDGALTKAHGNIKITEVNGKKISFNVISGMSGWLIRNFDIGSEFDGWCTLIEEKEEEPEIKVGDKVRVVDCGQNYSEYAAWFKLNAPDLAVYYGYKGSTQNGIFATVKRIAPHSTYCPKKLLAIEDEYGIIRLINETGVKKVEG